HALLRPSPRGYSALRRPQHLRVRDRSGDFRCAVKRRWSTAGKKDPPGNWIAPPGSNWSGGGGNKAAGASDEEGRTRRLGESAGRNASQRGTGLENHNAGADSPEIWGRVARVSF